MDGVEVNMEINERGLLQSAKNLYNDGLSFLRELYQNAVDSGAKNLNIDVGHRVISAKDDGSGMSTEFITEEFNNIGKRFKTSSGMIGHYGIGRLSLWAPIIREKDGAIKYYGRIELHTCDGNRQTDIAWNEISKYSVMESEPRMERGTEIKIISDAQLFSRLPSKNEAFDYLKNTILESRLALRVNGQLIKNEYEAPACEKTIECRLYNIRDWKFKNYTMRAKYIPGMDRILIAENGIKAYEDKSDFSGFAYGGIIDFLADKNDESILSLNRESIAVRDFDLEIHFYNDVVIPYYSDLSFARRSEKAEEMINFIDFVYRRYSLHRTDEKIEYTTILDFIDKIVIDFKELGAWKNEQKVVWSKANDRNSVMAETLGYKVLYSQANRNLETIFNLRNIPSIETIESAIRNAYRFRGPQSKSEESALDRISTYLSGIMNKKIEWIGKLDSKISEIGKESDGGSKIEIDPGSLPDYITTLGPGIVIGKVVIYLAEHEDESVKVFKMKNKGNEIIALNVKNHFVKECIENNRIDMIMPRIIYEFGRIKDDEYLGFGNRDFYNSIEGLYKAISKLQVRYTAGLEKLENGSLGIPKTEFPDKNFPGDEINIILRKKAEQVKNPKKKSKN